MNRKRLIYFTDLVLFPLFVLSFYSGIELHIAGHGTEHAIWYNRAVFHTIASLFFALFGIMHVKTHWAWYKGLKAKRWKGKSRIVLLLSSVFVCTVATGIVLLVCIEGANSSAGLLHYKTGLVMGGLGILHILKRIRRLYNVLNSQTAGLN